MNSRFDPEANQWPANIPDEPTFSPVTEFALLQTQLMAEGKISRRAGDPDGFRCEVCDGILRGDREIKIGAHAHCLDDV